MNAPPPAEQEPTNNPSKRTLWHRLLGKLLELLLVPLDVTVLTEVPVMSEPPKADILLLRRTGMHWTPEQALYLPDGVRTSQAQHILLEFKYRETVNDLVFQQALGYDYFYGQGQRLGRGAIETFVISGQTPQRATLNEFGYVVAEQPGVYRSHAPLLKVIPLLVLNELRNEPHNAFVKLFATRQSAQRAALAVFTPQVRQQLPHLVWDYIVGLEAGLAARGGKMIEGLTPEIVMGLGEDIRRLVFDTASPEERKQLLANASPEERKQLLANASPEERLAGLGPEELVALVAQIEAYLRTQKTGTQADTQ